MLESKGLLHSSKHSMQHTHDLNQLYKSCMSLIDTKVASCYFYELVLLE
jgi:hypothetical protein